MTAPAPSLSPAIGMEDLVQRRKLWPRREDDPFAQLAELRVEYCKLQYLLECRDREIDRLEEALDAR